MNIGSKYNIVKYTPSSGVISTVGGNNLDGTIYGIFYATNGNLYVVGDFAKNFTYITSLSASSWYIEPQYWPQGPCYAIVQYGDFIVVGGSFTMLEGTLLTRFKRIATYELARAGYWGALGSGTDGPVYALAVSGTDLYAGGSFSSPGANIAKWNGSAWSGLDVGLQGGVCSVITIIGTDIYVGGEFTSAGNVAGTAYIAKWNGSAWKSLGLSLNGPCRTIRVSGSDVYVGGDFTSANGITVNRIVKVIISSTVTGSVIENSSAKSTITFANEGCSILLDRSSDKWSVISKSAGVTLT